MKSRLCSCFLFLGLLSLAAWSKSSEAPDRALSAPARTVPESESPVDTCASPPLDLQGSRTCSDAEHGDRQSLWGGRAVVTVEVKEHRPTSRKPSSRIRKVDLQECSVQGVCQWLGSADVESPPLLTASFSTERGLESSWILVVTAHLVPQTILQRLTGSSKTAQLTFQADDMNCRGADGGCVHELGEAMGGVVLTISHFDPPNHPLVDDELQLLGANFSAFAVKEFPFTSWLAPLRSECREWRLLARHHNCSLGAHSGTWLSVRPLGSTASSETSEAAVVVAFKGTDFLVFQEVYTDLKMNLVPCIFGGRQIGRCAAGFYQAYQSLRDSVMGSLKNAAEELAGQGAELLITGHSLGATMATLMFADILQDPTSLPFRPTRTVAWHFGSPIVGDSEFRDVLAQLEVDNGEALNLRDHVRMVSVDSKGTSDFITHYPLCVPSAASFAIWGSTPGDYHHVGTRRYLWTRGQGPRLNGNCKAPKGILATRPGAHRLTDLLWKGANTLHDERDNYLPMALSFMCDDGAPGSDLAKCSGRSEPIPEVWSRCE